MMCASTGEHYTVGSGEGTPPPPTYLLPFGFLMLCDLGHWFRLLTSLLLSAFISYLLMNKLLCVLSTTHL